MRAATCLDMLVNQTLESGTLIRQDFRDAVRFVMFETGYEGFDYATHGGTLFVVVFRGRPYGVTCAHVKGDFEWRQLVVTDSKFGRAFAQPSAIYRPSSPTEHAVDSDVLDLAIIEFVGDVGPAFFGDTTYILDRGTVASSARGEQLYVNGAFKSESEILDSAIKPQFGLLEFQDDGLYGSDLVLRRAIARFQPRTFQSLTGLSGSPVFNISQGRLAGVVSRGSLTGDDAVMHYIDINHVHRMVVAIANGEKEARYRVATPR